jgi:putative FmdB family regulatory protein
MPTYEYVCTKCGERLEAVQSFSDAPLTDCPHCGKKKALRKVFSAVGVVFKGSGFYTTDSRANGKKAATPASEPAANGAKPDSTAPAAKESSSGSSSDSAGSTTTPSTTGSSKVA